jgi:hypothetical protein
MNVAAREDFQTWYSESARNLVVDKTDMKLEDFQMLR